MALTLAMLLKFHKSLPACGAALMLMLTGAASVSSLLEAPAKAQTASGFYSYLDVLRAEAVKAGVRQTTLDSVMPTLQYQADAIRLDRAQPGGAANSDAIPAYAPYRRIHVTADRVQKGQRKLANLRPVLARIEAQTGVPASFMIAIYGKESSYGSYMGNTDVPSALATLAYEGRRRDFFTKEFVASLQMVDRGVPRWKLKGSWAGAMGMPQFMPSTYDRLAKDGDGDGLADIWSSEADAMASIANYFYESGWRRGVPWGFSVNVPQGLDRASLASNITAPRCPRVFDRHSSWKTMAEWRAMGVAPRGGYWPAEDNVLATLLEPDFAGNPGYLLTSNYRVILDYNCSNFYALTVGILADEIGK